MALAEVDGKNRPEAPFVGRKMRGRRWLNTRSKVLNRNGAFVGIEGVTGAVEISFAPFVRNRNVGRRTDFDDFREGTVREAESGATVVWRKAGREKLMRVCEAP
jgi:hypothetical protein